MNIVMPKAGLVALVSVAAAAAFASEPPDPSSLIPPEEGAFSAFDAGAPPAAPWNLREMVAPSRVLVMREAQSPFPSRGRAAAEEVAAGVVWEDAEASSWGPLLIRRHAPLEAHHGKVLWAFDYLVPLDSTESGPIVFLANEGGSANRAGPTLFLCQQPGRLHANDGASMVDIGTVQLGTWHRVEIVVDLGRQTYDVTLQRWNGKPVSLAKNLGFRSAGALPLRYLTIGDASRDKFSGASVFIDNVVLAPLPDAR